MKLVNSFQFLKFTETYVFLNEEFYGGWMDEIILNLKFKSIL